VARFPLVGVGGGGYSIAELTTRTVYESSFSVSAHNEYLEALIEGGVVRFALTIALVVSAVWSITQRYRRSRDPLLLGSILGLGAVAIHSIGEFGIHTPSAAIAAAVVTAYSTRRQEPDGVTATGATAIAAGVFVVLAALLVVLADWRALRVDRLRAVAALTARPDEAARFLEAASQLRPNDPEVWEELATAHLLAAAEEGGQALAGVIGFAEAVRPVDVLPGTDPNGHVVAALRAARAGRTAQPLMAGFHLRLGAFAGHFARSEPAAVHFERAQRIGRANPDVWYVSGRAAAERGDWSTALADWHEMLALSPRRLAAIARIASGRVSSTEFRERALPDRPAIWFAVTPQLFLDESAPGRSDWLRAIVDRCARTEPESVAGFVAWGSALEDLHDASAALHVWRRGVERFPEDVPLRDHLAARLEAEERYEEALPVLEWLTARESTRGDYRQRLAAAKHALELKAVIDGP
jgi:tetratricopeptide (TPR) repeat protein